MSSSPARRLTLAQLRALEAVARLGSFSAAAKEQGMSQPSISNHITAAEKISRARLIARDGHSAGPAPALADMLPQIRALLSLAEDIEARFAAARSVAQGRLRVGYSTYQLTMPIIGRFMRAYPGIRIEARSMASLDVMEELDAGRIEVGFVTARDMPAHCAGRHLVTSPIVLMLPPDHPLARKGRADWADIAGLPLIQREYSSGTRRLFEGAAQLARVQLNTLLSLGSWGSIVTMVREGVGAGVALALEVEATDGLTAVPIAEGRLDAAHYVVCLGPMAEVAAVSAFLDCAAAHYDSPVSSAHS